MRFKVGIAKGDLVGNTNTVIQQAIEAAAAWGGGTVELGPGVYTLYDSVKLRRNIHLVGSGADTILRKSDGSESGFAVDADYGQAKVTAADPSGFCPGMGVVVTDDRSGGWGTTVATVLHTQGNVLYLDRGFVSDYNGDEGGIVYNAFPPISGIDVDGVTVEGICVDGNKANNRRLNGCVGGGIYLHRARRCRIADCVVKDFNGDGISFQITQDITVEGCEVTGITGLGFHPGTGSARPIIRNCRAHHNAEDGFFLCWRAQEGIFENNQFCENGRHGISIGHKDTDNLFVGNVVRGNGAHGIYFRNEKPTNAGSRNTFRENAVEDNIGCGIYIEGHTTDLLFENNVIRETRTGDARTQRMGIWAGPHTARVRTVKNRIEGHIEAAVAGGVTEA